MDKYHHLRTTGNRLCESVIGKTVVEVNAACKETGFVYRVLSRDGNYCMVTADVRMDRLGLTLKDGKVIAATIG